MVTRHPSKAPSSPRGTQTWLAVVRAYNLCDAVMSARLAGLGLRVAEHEVLVNLAAAPGMTQQELAARCFVAKSGVSMLLTQLEGKRWVERAADANDARVKRLFLTAAGRALAAKTLNIQSEVVAEMADGATVAELATVAEVMQRVAARLEALRRLDAASSSRRLRPAPRASR